MKQSNLTFWNASAPENYSMQENADYIIWCSGIIIGKDGNGTVMDLLTIGLKAFCDDLDYNQVSGWFKFVVYAKEKDEWLFCGDHSGSQYFFYDSDNGVFSDRLLRLRAMRGVKVEPDMAAISELFSMARTFNGKTIVQGISKTNPDCFYRYRNGKIEEFPKRLYALSLTEPHTQLDDVINPLLEVIKDKKVCAVCTGGTDSRTVLAVLSQKGVKPDLVITGHSENPDIIIAKKVADILELSLTIIDPSLKEPEWLKRSFSFFDGQYDVVLGYRHLQKAKWVQAAGYAFEFGGVGGEFYKNAFCCPIRWGLTKKQDEQYLYDNLFIANTSQISWCSDKLKSAAKKNAESIRKIVRASLCENSLLQKCNHIGFDILRTISGSITNGYASVCCKIDPLMDQRLIADASYENLMTHSMHMWQRRQIAKYCPSLSNIETDQGYSCSLNPLTLFKERIKRLAFYSGRVRARIQRRLGLHYKTANVHYWDSDYADARTTSTWTDAVAYCKKAGIIDIDITDERIPMEQTGFVLLIGMMFGNGFNARLYSIQRMP